MMWFMATLAKFWSSGSRNMTEIVVSGRYLENDHLTYLMRGIYIGWVSLQKWFDFWPVWPNSGPLLAAKRLKWMIIFHTLSEIQITIWCMNWLCESSDIIRIFVTLVKCFIPLVVAKWLKLIASYHYYYHWSPNPLHACCIHWLGDWYEMIWFWPCQLCGSPPIWMALLRLRGVTAIRSLNLYLFIMVRKFTIVFTTIPAFFFLNRIWYHFPKTPVDREFFTGVAQYCVKLRDFIYSVI